MCFSPLDHYHMGQVLHESLTHLEFLTPLHQPLVLLLRLGSGLAFRHHPIHTGDHMMSIRRTSGYVIIAIVVLLASVPPAQSADSPEQEFVLYAASTVQQFTEDQNLGFFRTKARDARALFIVPEILRGAFFIGASSGSGVLMVRDRETWNGPAFYRIGGASFGLQMGADAAQVIFLIMTDRGLKSFYRSSAKLGLDASIAAGSDGDGVGVETSPTLSADILVFSRAQGGYMGVSFEGSAVLVADKSNEAYYGRPVQPVEILEKSTLRNPGATPLLQTLADLTQ